MIFSNGSWSLFSATNVSWSGMFAYFWSSAWFSLTVEMASVSKFADTRMICSSALSLLGALPAPRDAVRPTIYTWTTRGEKVDIVFLQTNWNWTNCLVGLPKTCIYEYKPRTNGRNIVGQQILKLVDVGCCVLLHKKLLSVVGNCCAKFETGQTFEPASPHISLVPSSPKCSSTMYWIRLHILFNHSWGHKRALHMISLKTATH